MSRPHRPPSPSGSPSSTTPARRHRVETGVRVDSGTLQAFVKINGRQRAKRFPLNTPLKAIRAWRADQQAAHRHGWPSEAITTTLAQDADTYLGLVAHMPTYTDRAYRIRQWVAALGHEPRARLTAPVIRAQLERWRLSGRVDGGPLSAGSLNTRRTALLHLWTVLDGKGSPNPVKDVPPYREATGEPIRALSWPAWYRVLACLRKGSKTRARLRVMLWTGWPHAQLMALRPEDIDWRHARAQVSPRRKGKGYPSVWLPLLPAAVTALRAFAAANAWGRFSQSAMHSALQRAVVAANQRRGSRSAIPHLRPYDARHSFGTMLAQRTTDDRAIQDLMLHGTARQTRRYTTGASLTRLEQAVAAIAGTFGSLSPPVSAPQRPSRAKSAPAKRQAKARPISQKS